MASEASSTSAASLPPDRCCGQSRAQSRNCQPAIHARIITPRAWQWVPVF